MYSSKNNTRGTSSRGGSNSRGGSYPRRDSYSRDGASSRSGASRGGSYSNDRSSGGNSYSRESSPSRDGSYSNDRGSRGSSYSREGAPSRDGAYSSDRGSRGGSYSRGGSSRSGGSYGRNSGSSYGRGYGGGYGRNSGSSYGGGRNRRRVTGSSIDINKLIKTAVEPKAAIPYKNTHFFKDFALNNALLRNLEKKNFTTPTPIQDQSIKQTLEGKNLVGIANTGTGKTGAFLIPSINKVFNDRKEKVLIIVPTRELALQINDEFREFSKDMGLYSVQCIGGTPMGRQIGDLRRHYNFLIATPGRLKDMVDKDFVKLSEFKTLVLDEVDRMLDMGFIDEVKYFLARMPEDLQVLLFSATMPRPIETLIDNFVKDPIRVSVKTSDTSDNIHQDVVRVKSQDDKINQLKEILNRSEVERVLIFVRTKRGVDKIKQRLDADGYSVESIHGDKPQNKRQRALKMFKTNEVNVLIATDVASRGLDIPDVSHVINYDIPENFEEYSHRIGRTGRAGKIGWALTFV